MKARTKRLLKGLQLIAHVWYTYGWKKGRVANMFHALRDDYFAKEQLDEPFSVVQAEEE